MSSLVQCFSDDRYFGFPCYSLRPPFLFNPRKPCYLGVIVKTVDINKRWFERQGWYGASDTAIVVQGAGADTIQLILTKEEAQVLVQCFAALLGDRSSRHEKLDKMHTIKYSHADAAEGEISVDLSRGVGNRSIKGPHRLVTFYKRWKRNVRSTMLYEAYADQLVETIEKALSCC